jgi:hypothetical protein
MLMPAICSPIAFSAKPVSRTSLTPSFHFADGSVDQPLDLLGGLGGTLGEFTHFLGDDRKAAAGIASAGCLDTGIQRQKIGLQSDFVNHADDVGDLLRRRFDPAHRLNGMRDDLHGSGCTLIGVNDDVSPRVDCLDVTPRLYHSDNKPFRICLARLS